MRSGMSAPSRCRLATLAAGVCAVAVAGLLSGCSDSSTSAGLEESGETREATAPEPATSQQTAVTPDGDTIVAKGGDLPDGTYRVEFTDRYLADHGMDGGAVAFNHGVWTHTLQDGHWTVEQVAPDLTDRFEGVYQVDGENLYWRFHDTKEVLHLRWSTDAEGDLHFTQVTDTGAYDDFQFDLPWTRVG